MKYYIGIDGGGTKTLFKIADSDGTVLGSVKMGSASYKQISIEGVVRLLHEGIGTVLKEAGITGAHTYYTCFGMPMYGEYPEKDKKIVELIDRHLPQYRIKVVNDVEVGWAGSLGMMPGINVVAGTGSIAFGRDEQGRSAKAGGWSEFFSDEGSCNWIGRRTAEYFAKEADDRLPKGALYSIVREKFQLEDDYDMIEMIEEEYIPYRDKMASLQLVLKEAAIRGDEQALRLYDEAAYELSLIAGGVYRQLGMQEGSLLSYSGGLFQAGELIMIPFQKYLKPLGLRLIPPKMEPALGAILLASYYGDKGIALEAFGIDKQELETSE